MSYHAVSPYQQTNPWPDAFCSALSAADQGMSYLTRTLQYISGFNGVFNFGKSAYNGSMFSRHLGIQNAISNFFYYTAGVPTLLQGVYFAAKEQLLTGCTAEQIAHSRGQTLQEVNEKIQAFIKGTK